MEPSDDFSPIPPGVYDVEIIESDVVPTKAGDGTMVNLTMRVVAGPFENRRIWSRINIENRSEKAQEIGQRQLSDLARACGMAAVPAETEDFHGHVFRVNVKVTPGDGNYGPKNEVNRYLAADGPAPANAPAPQPRAAAPSSKPAAGNGNKPSWMNRKAG
jgi:hypothetical protein